MDSEKAMSNAIERQEAFVDAIVEQLQDWVDSFGINAELTQDIGAYRTWRTEVGNVFEYYKVLEEQPDIEVEEDSEEYDEDYLEGVAFCVAIVFSPLNEVERDGILKAMMGEECVIITPTEGVAFMCVNNDVTTIRTFEQGDIISSDVLDGLELTFPSYQN